MMLFLVLLVLFSGWMNDFEGQILNAFPKCTQHVKARSVERLAEKEIGENHGVYAQGQFEIAISSHLRPSVIGHDFAPFIVHQHEIGVEIQNILFAYVIFAIFVQITK